MKKVILALLVASTFAACNNGDSDKPATDTTKATVVDTTKATVVDTTKKAVVDTTKKAVVDTAKKAK